MAAALIAIAASLFVLYFLYVVGSLYATREILVHRERPVISERPFISIIIPVRNEEDNIEHCVSSLLKQSYPTDRYEILVVDDSSTDETVSIVRGLMAVHPAVRLAEAGDLPEGWTGKNNACRVGAELATGDWYCFVDADISAEKQLLTTTIAHAHANELDVMSVNPFQELHSFSERAFLPAVFVSISATMNFSKVNDPSRPEAVANGQFMLFRRTAYEKIEGHLAVRQEVMEDLAFARLVKNSGLRFYWTFGDGLIRTRMYKDLWQIWHGFSKNLADILGIKTVIGSIGTLAKSLLLGWAPIVLPLFVFLNLCGEQGLGVETLACVLSVVSALGLWILCVMIARALEIPFAYAFFFPAGFTLHGLLAVNSAWKRKKGRRKWKGREY
jgi:chlorobactene glucosyltransferase